MQRFFTVLEAADILGIKKTTAYKLIQRGELLTVRVSERAVRVPESAIDAYQHMLIQRAEVQRSAVV